VKARRRAPHHPPSLRAVGLSPTKTISFTFFIFQILQSSFPGFYYSPQQYHEHQHNSTGIMAALLFSLLLLRAMLTQAGNLTAFVHPLYATRGGAGLGGWGCQARNPGAMFPSPFLRLGPDTTRFDPVLGEVWSHLNRKFAHPAPRKRAAL